MDTIDARWDGMGGIRNTHRYNAHRDGMGGIRNTHVSIIQKNNNNFNNSTK